MSAWERSDFIPRHFTAGNLHAERCDIPQLEGLFDLGMTFLEDPAGAGVLGVVSHDRDLFRPDTADAGLDHNSDQLPALWERHPAATGRRSRRGRRSHRGGRTCDQRPDAIAARFLRILAQGTAEPRQSVARLN
jgi:hypothetical protein